MHAGAVAEPEMVFMFIEHEERELKAKGYEPGERFYHDYLREKMPGFATSWGTPFRASLAFR